MAKLDELDSLQLSLNTAIDTLRAEIKSAGLPSLSTQASELHVLDDPNFLPSPRLWEARRLALACIGQLKTLLQIPYEKVVEQSFAVYDTACLDVLVRAGVAEVLARAPDVCAGLHVRELQAALDLNANKLATILRYATTQGWVRESSEGVFALNRPGFELLDGRNGRKWALTTGKPKVAAALLEWIQHPQWRHSESCRETAFQIANDTDLDLFAYLEKHPALLQQFANSVQSIGDSFVAGVVRDYPWGALETPTIVDCGGGQGNLTVCLAEAFPAYHFVIQDLPAVVPLAARNIAIRAPDVAAAGRITVEAHDLFARQPRVGAYSFMFRYVLHDWPEDSVVEILRQAACAAGPKSKILIIEFVAMPGTVADREPADATNLDALTGADTYRALPPPPHIPMHYGAVSRAPLALGVHLMGVMNAQERTLAEWERAITRAGLRISGVYPLRAITSVIECELAAPAPASSGPARF